jgi:hypothetical protein
MGKVYGTHGGDVRIKSWSGNLKRRDLLEDISVDRRVMSKWFFSVAHGAEGRARWWFVNPAVNP